MENPDLKRRISQCLKECDLSARAASIAAGLGPDGIRNILRDKSRNPRSDTLNHLARLFGVTPQWLLNGEISESQSVESQPDRSDFTPPADFAMAQGSFNKVAILGTAAGSLKGAFQINSDPIDYVCRMAGIASAHDIYALYIVGDSMEPRYYEGELVYVSAKRPARIGDFVILEIQKEKGENEAFCKKLCKKTAHEIWVRQFNPPLELRFPIQDVKSIHKVLSLNELVGH